MDVFHHRNLINFCDILGRNGEILPKVMRKTTCLTNEAVKETLGDFLPSSMPVSGANFAERMEGLRSCKYYQRQESSASLELTGLVLNLGFYFFSCPLRVVVHSEMDTQERRNTLHCSKVTGRGCTRHHPTASCSQLSNVRVRHLFLLRIRELVNHNPVEVEHVERRGVHLCPVFLHIPGIQFPGIHDGPRLFRLLDLWLLLHRPLYSLATFVVRPNLSLLRGLRLCSWSFDRFRSGSLALAHLRILFLFFHGEDCILPILLILLIHHIALELEVRSCFFLRKQNKIALVSSLGPSRTPPDGLIVFLLFVGVDNVRGSDDGLTPPYKAIRGAAR